MLRALALPPHEARVSAAVSEVARPRLSRPVVRGVNWRVSPESPRPAGAQVLRALALLQENQHGKWRLGSSI